MGVLLGFLGDVAGVVGYVDGRGGVWCTNRGVVGDGVDADG